MTGFTEGTAVRCAARACTAPTAWARTACWTSWCSAARAPSPSVRALLLLYLPTLTGSHLQPLPYSVALLASFYSRLAGLVHSLRFLCGAVQSTCGPFRHRTEPINHMSCYVHCVCACAQRRKLSQGRRSRSCRRTRVQRPLRAWTRWLPYPKRPVGLACDYWHNSRLHQCFTLCWNVWIRQSCGHGEGHNLPNPRPFSPINS